MQLAPPGAAFQTAFQPPPIPHHAPPHMHGSVAAASPSSAMMHAVSGSSAAAIQGLQQSQARGQRAALRSAFLPVVHMPAQPPVQQGQPLHGVVSGNVPGSAAAQHACAAMHAPDAGGVAVAHVLSQAQHQQSTSVSRSQSHSQSQSMSLPDSAEIQQLVSMRLQDQVMSYMAAMAGLQPGQLPQPVPTHNGAAVAAVAAPPSGSHPVLNGSQPSARQQTQLDTQQRQLSAIQHRALQAGALL